MAEKIKSRKRTSDKWKKKIWYTIYAPKEFDRKEIGETVASKEDSLMGRTIELSVGKLTNQPKRKYVTIYFKINEVKGNKAYTVTVGHEIKEAYLRRLIRRRSSKIETIKEIQTKEGTKVRIKAITVCSRKVKKSQKTAIRKIMAEKIGELNKEVDSNNVIPELIFGNTLMKISNSVKKVAPIKKVEIIKSKIIKS